MKKFILWKSNGGNDSEFILDDVCEDCFDRFKGIINNAERWRKEQSL